MKTNTPQHPMNQNSFFGFILFFPPCSRKRADKVWTQTFGAIHCNRQTYKREWRHEPPPPPQTWRFVLVFMPQLWLIMSHPLNAPSASILSLSWSRGCCCLTSVICYFQWCNMLSGGEQYRGISWEGRLLRLPHHPFLLCFFFSLFPSCSNPMTV